MIRYFKIIFIFILSQQLTADEIFIQKEGLSLSERTFSETYCKQLPENRKLCLSKKIAYLDYEESDLPSFLYGVKKHIQPKVDKYRAENVRKLIRDEVEESKGDIAGEWYNETYIELYAKTPQTYTLAQTTNGYTGGAHGYYVTELYNYAIDTQKNITLKELFLPDSNATLHKIALKYYKKIHNLHQNQTLLDDGWFEDKFVLAQNFAITPRGLNFYYNAYEIKSYADGSTEFMLPYSKLHTIINPKGPLAFALTKHTVQVSYSEKEKMAIDIEATKNDNQTMTITAKMSKLTYFDKGWLSLSFPQLTDKSHIIQMTSKGFKTLHAYPKGSKIYNVIHKKAIKSNYLLVEGEDQQWSDETTDTISITIKVPKGEEELILDVRGTLKDGTKTITLPDEFHGVAGQQGYTNHRIFIAL